MLTNPVHRWLDVVLRRAPRPEDERERKDREIADLSVKYNVTDRIAKRLVEQWRRRG